MNRVALAAGGTAGHVYPALAVAGELRRRNVEVLFFGTRHGRESSLLRDEPFPLAMLPGRPFHGHGVLGRACAVATVPVSAAASARLLRREKIDAVIGFGGYASVGPVLAAHLLGVRCAILEPNAVAGMANRLLARIADRIYIGTITTLESPKVLRVGAPVREEILAARARRNAARAKPRVLVFDSDLAFDWGGGDFEVIRASRLAHIADGYAACDLVVSRSGAGVLAEIALFGLPSIIVPLEAAEDHQSRNAAVVAAAGAAVISDAAGLRRAVDTLLADRDRCEALGRRAATFAAPDATRLLVDDMLASPHVRSAR